MGALLFRLEHDAMAAVALSDLELGEIVFATARRLRVDVSRADVSSVIDAATE